MKGYKIPFPPTVILLMGVVAISFSSILVKWSAAPASILGMYRLLLTVIMLFPFLPWKKLNKVSKDISRRDWFLLFISGLFLGLHFLFWMDSLKYTTVASSMILTTLEPVFVMIGAYFIFKEKTNIFGILSILIAITGSIIIASGDIGLSSTALYGDFLSILGTLAVAIHMLAGQDLCRKIPPSIYSFFVFLIGGIILFFYNIINGLSLIEYPVHDWWIFLLLALVPNIFGHVLFNWLLRFVDATTISMGVLGEPIGAIILAYLLLGETTSLSQIIGGILAIIGVGMFLKHKSSSNLEISNEVINPNN
ncbi:DMT family transporter [Bacillus chungangensis]|uniref:Drug/metabolite transporter (DMT)-like permease n=1 Tax=Bacillus chungangensis TaxID=587633 RepID=A0ABT9WNX4_9BACI|nr:DMT family transporter [Bacillus chungangensis]MDQ0174944.1 drug/metabolite transporter (DMT)-like permease [Bacillus chungangensis]